MPSNNHNAFRKNPVVSWLVALALLVAATFLPQPALALDSGDIFVTSTRGEVQVTMNGAPKQVRAGTVLVLPATVRTGRDGAIELRQGATTVSVGPDTLLDFPAPERPGGPIDRIQQPRGNAFYSIGKRDGRKLRVETPYLVGVVKGTQFNVAAQDEATTISLFEGLLEIHATDESSVVDIKAGEIASRRKGGKSINVIRMDASRQPTTAPRAQANGQGEDSSVRGSAAAPAGSSPVERPGAGNGVVTVNEPGREGLPGSVGADVRAPGVAVGSDASVSLGSGNAVADVATNVAVGNGVEASSNISVSAGNHDVSTEISAGVGVNAGVASTDISASAGVTVGAGGVSIDNSLGASVGAGPVAVDVSANTSVDVGASGVAADVGVGAAVAAGPVTVDTGGAASIDVGAGGVSAGLGTSTAVDTGPVTAVVDTGTTVDVGAGGIGADLTTGAAVDAGPVTADLGTSAAVDVGAGGTVAVDTGASLAVAGTDVSAGVSVGANVSTGTVDLGVSVGGVDLGLGLDLGLGGSEPATDTGSPTNPATDTGNTGTIDVGGLLDGLLRRPGRR
jgi:hypothetical protein